MENEGVRARMDTNRSSLVDFIAQDVTNEVKRAFDVARPFSWTVVATDVIGTVFYRGEHVTTKRLTFTPPEKERLRDRNFDRFFDPFVVERPQGLRADNTVMRYYTRDWSRPLPKKDPLVRAHMTPEDAIAYIDAQLALDANAELLAPLIAALNNLPCSCGEYGSTTDREELENAYAIYNLVRSIK